MAEKRIALRRREKILREMPNDFTERGGTYDHAKRIVDSWHITVGDVEELMRRWPDADIEKIVRHFDILNEGPRDWRKKYQKDLEDKGLSKLELIELLKTDSGMSAETAIEELEQRKSARKPIKKLVVITHPSCNALEEHEQRKIVDDLTSIVRKNAKDETTHFVVSWSEGTKDTEFLTKLKQLFKEIPANRLHEPEGREENFTNKTILKKHFNDLNFADEIELEGYGSLVDGCHSMDLRGVADFLSKKSNIKTIKLLGGKWSEPTLNRLFFEGPTQFDKQLDPISLVLFVPDPVRGSPKEALNPYRDKLVIPWFQGYKKNE